MRKIFSSLVILTVLLGGCTKDDPLLPNEEGLQLTCNLKEVEPGARYHTLRVDGVPAETGTYITKVNAAWARLERDTLAEDGIMELWVEENTDVRRRSLQVTVSNVNDPFQSGTIEIFQKGLGESDENTSGDPLSDFRIGWGMNAYDEYQSSNSIRGRVFDLNALAALDKEDEFQSVQEIIRAQSDFMNVSATSEREMSALLTSRQDKSSNFLGVKKTMRRYSQVSKNMSSQQYCSYARITKVVASRSIDAGTIQYIVEKMPVTQIPFTSRFREVYEKIKNNNGAKRDQQITTMLNEFGTHVVIEAYAGGMIDYIGTFSRTQTSQLESIAEEQSKRVLGIANSSASNTLKNSLISDISQGASVEIKGGDPILRNNLIQGISKLDRLDVIPNKQLQEWFSSIVYTGSNKKELDLVDFKVMPIWQLFADKTISQQILMQVLKMQEQSNNKIPDQELGMDNYSISLQDSRFSFSNTDKSNTSLVKIYYVNNVPVLEICEEYVPKIRSDQRIQVFYPIYLGKTNHSQGLFPGDGEGNRPASIAFYEGDCYVTPIEEYGTSQKLSNIYYIHGNLYEKDYGNACAVPKNTTVQDHRLQFSEWDVSYPVVKIGPGYWTRTYITRKMQFGVKGAGGRFMTKEEVVDGILFADIYQTNSTGFLFPNEEIFGQHTEAYYGKQTLWYLPLTRDRKHLIEYLGGNMKTLFKGQMTGFDAQFEGYYGSYDESGNDLGKTTRRENGKKCYVAFKDGTTSSSGVAMVLTPDYTWKSIVTSAAFNYYPVRLFRTSCYIHDNL
jgi:uncharacterized protein with PIN domain